MQPVWFALENERVVRNEKTPFDLQVKVALRGSTTAGNLPFQSAFYLSLDDRLDTATDTQVSNTTFYVHSIAL